MHSRTSLTADLASVICNLLTSCLSISACSLFLCPVLYIYICPLSSFPSLPLFLSFFSFLFLSLSLSLSSPDRAQRYLYYKLISKRKVSVTCTHAHTLTQAHSHTPHTPSLTHV